MSAASRGLGRGLDSLIAAASTQQRAPIDAIAPNPSQPRREFDDEQLAELAASIRAHGILQPLLVQPLQSGRYQLIAGERRWRAARLAGLDSVPIVVQTDADGADNAAERLTLALAENVQRTNLNPIELAGAFEQLAAGGWTQQRIADEVGKSRAAVANALRLLKLPPQVQDWIASGELSEGHGRALAGAPPAQQQSLAQRSIEQGWTVRRLEEAAAERSQRRRRPARPEPPPSVRRAAERWQSTLSARVDVRVAARGPQHGGQLVIHWRDEAELQALTRQIGADAD